MSRMKEIKDNLKEERDSVISEEDEEQLESESEAAAHSMISNVSVEMAINEDLVQMVHCMAHALDMAINPDC